jgi:Usher syndrome type-1G protein
VNLWALDIDFHTAKELAAMNNREDVLRFLDGTITTEETSKPKVAKAKRDKALKEAEKRLKSLEKQHKKVCYTRYFKENSSYKLFNSEKA